MALVLTFFFLQKDLGPALVLTCVFLALLRRSRAAGPRSSSPGSRCCSPGSPLAYWIGQSGDRAAARGDLVDPWNNGVPGGNHDRAWTLGACRPAVRGARARARQPAARSRQATPTSCWPPSARSSASIGSRRIVLPLYALPALALPARRACARPATTPRSWPIGVALGPRSSRRWSSPAAFSGSCRSPASSRRSSATAARRCSPTAVAVGIVLAIAQRRGARARAPARARFARCRAVLGSRPASIVLGRAGWVQVRSCRRRRRRAEPDRTGRRRLPVRVQPAPSVGRAAGLMRGTIYDRNGLPLATSRPDEIAVDRRRPTANAGRRPRETRLRSCSERAAIRSAGSPSICSATGRTRRTGRRGTRRTSNATATPS